MVIYVENTRGERSGEELKTKMRGTWQSKIRKTDPKQAVFFTPLIIFRH